MKQSAPTSLPPVCILSSAPGPAAVLTLSPVYVASSAHTAFADMRNTVGWENFFLLCFCRKCSWLRAGHRESWVSRPQFREQGWEGPSPTWPGTPLSCTDMPPARAPRRRTSPASALHQEGPVCPTLPPPAQSSSQTSSSPSLKAGSRGMTIQKALRASLPRAPQSCSPEHACCTPCPLSLGLCYLGLRLFFQTSMWSLASPHCTAVLPIV